MMTKKNSFKDPRVDSAIDFLSKTIDPSLYGRDIDSLAIKNLNDALDGKKVSDNQFTPIEDTLSTEKKYLVSERDLFMFYDAGMANIDSDGCHIYNPLRDFNDCLSDLTKNSSNDQQF